MKKILFLLPNSVTGSPALERVNSFIEFYQQEGFYIEKIPYPSNIREFISFLKLIYSKKISYIFVSQPPFRYPIIFALPFSKKIVDYRDGWSIAIDNGYGGLARPNIFKARIARRIERFAIRKSNLVITCTPGLKQYLENISGNKNILMIPNGISQENFDYISDLPDSPNLNDDILRFYCAGKFSEYGVEKVKGILDLIQSRYYNKKIQINLVGCDYKANEWITSYLPKNSDFTIKERMCKQELYEELNKADIFLSVVREEEYELGTKIYEYIAFQKPIFNYSKLPNNFTRFFDGFFDIEGKTENKPNHKFIREKLIEEHRNEILKKMGG